MFRYITLCYSVFTCRSPRISTNSTYPFSSAISTAFIHLYPVLWFLFFISLSAPHSNKNATKSFFPSLTAICRAVWFPQQTFMSPDPNFGWMNRAFTSAPCLIKYRITGIRSRVSECFGMAWAITPLDGEEAEISPPASRRRRIVSSEALETAECITVMPDVAIPFGSAPCSRHHFTRSSS
ncbi:hypothetical protein DM02DRAFT_374086 [Periconia macrospinosa]|uniref:Uncharacterized protein n=1 Tax=Periconia macrospinosa TaxID=97972 RepID=A0A2V1DUA5_9PLEO|nr:hypothetical protein DM02DRAFT_374086 [Periconia macrospinosa]